MSTTSYSPDSVRILRDDISSDMLSAAMDGLSAALDIETTGLDWRNDRIASVQVALSNGWIEVVRLDETSSVPERLTTLLTSASVLKVFHHAMFDLRFMRRAWNISAQRVACTKIAAKVGDPNGDIGHHLTDLVSHYLGERLDKSQQVSDWFAEDLTPDQVDYAANDVRYLIPLLYGLLSQLRGMDLERLVLRCFDHIPTRVELEVREYADVFVY